MKIVQKQISLYQTSSNSLIAKANKKYKPDVTRAVSATNRSVNKIMISRNIRNTLMPNIIGIGSADANYTSMCKNYLEAFWKPVPDVGLKLDISFDYVSKEVADKFEKREKEILDQFNKDILAGVEEKKALATKYDAIFELEDDKNEIKEGKVVVGYPVNADDYFTYLYCLFNSTVANREEDISKSANIMFYFVNEAERKAKDDTVFQLGLKVDKYFLDVVGDKDKLENILLLFGTDTKVLDKLEMQKAAKVFAATEPAKFIEYYEDKNLQTKATINKLIRHSILKQLTNSTIIVDGSDSSVIIGNNIEEAVSTFSSDAPKLKSLVNSYLARLKNLS